MTHDPTIAIIAAAAVFVFGLVVVYVSENWEDL